MTEPEAAIRVEGLVKSYGRVEALRGVSFGAARGEVLAYLGPNGAGKTTTINILCGLLRPDAGRVSVCGLDVDRQALEVKRRIGVVPEESNLYGELSCARNLEYLGELYGLSGPRRKQKAAELLAAFKLEEKAGAPFRTLSRGLKRRLILAAALVNSPEVVFLDEPTIGLDVPSARALRDLIRRLKQSGTTVFLTTHNLAEAEELSDRMAIIIRGRIVAAGAADQVRRRVERARVVEVSFVQPIEAGPIQRACPAVLAAIPAGEGFRLEVADAHQALMELAAFADREGLRIADLATPRPSLEEAFLSILEEEQGR